MVPFVQQSSPSFDYTNLNRTPPQNHQLASGSSWPRTLAHLTLRCCLWTLNLLLQHAA
jgi:hypothetical protein